MTEPEILKETVAGDKFLQLEESITDKWNWEKDSNLLKPKLAGDVKHYNMWYIWKDKNEKI